MKALRRVDILNYNFFDRSGERLYTGGAERYVVDLAALLRRKQFTVRLLQASEAPFTKRYKGLEVLGIPGPKEVDFKAMSALYVPFAQESVLAIASPIELACQLPSSVPSVGINHGVWWDNPRARGGESDLAARQPLLDALRMVRHCVCVDTNFVNWLRTVDANLLSRVTYVPNYVALDRFLPTKKHFEGPLRVLFPRRLCAERGFAEVIAAFDRILPRHPALSLDICGGGSDSEEQLAREFVARHKGQAEWFEMPMEEMPLVYTRSHIVVLPTINSEGTSLACIEAMATRNGVIASHVGGLGNLVINDFNGLLIAPGEGTLETAVERMLGDRQMLALLAANAVAVSSAFSYQRWENQWLQVLSQSLQDSGDPAIQKKTRSSVNHHLAHGNSLAPNALSPKPRNQATLTDAVAARNAATELAAMLSLERAEAIVSRDLAISELEAGARREALVRAEAQEVAQRAHAYAATMTIAAARLRDECLRLGEERLLVGAQLSEAREVNQALRADRASLEATIEGFRAKVADTSRETETVRTLLTEQLSRTRETEEALSVTCAGLRELTTQIASERERAGDELAETIVRLRRGDAVLIELQRSAEELAVRNTYLERTLTARDEGITWLRGELRAAHEQHLRRRTSVRLLLADGMQALADRFPALKHVIRSVVPKSVRRLVTDRSLKRGTIIRTGHGAEEPSTAIASQLNRNNSDKSDGSWTSDAQRVLESNAKFDILCFANIEWGARYQRPQHTMRGFADGGHRVFYIIASKRALDGRRYQLERVADNVFEVCLEVDHLEDFYGQTMSAKNEATMADAIQALARDQGVHLALSIVHLPYWTNLALQLNNEHGWRILYDCMDEWWGFPHIGQGLLDSERTLVERADLVTVTASLLEAKWKDKAKRCVVVRNAVDFAYFSQRCAPNLLLERIQHPIIGYYGALAEWVDFAMLADIARRRPDWNLVLVGDQFVSNMEGLEALPNVYLLGRQPYEAMPQYLYHFDVCLIPFKLNAVTHAVDPVKFYEYISVGKPVVSVPLSEMRMYEDYAYFAEGSHDFVARIGDALTESDATRRSARIELARANDWRDRHATMVQAVEALYPVVSIVVVTYNNVEFTKLCIESVLSHTQYPSLEIIIVDNGSTDGSRAYLNYLARAKKSVKALFNSSNRGFAAANNQGLALARGELIVLLNNDTVVPAGWLEPLLRHLRDDTIGVVGPVSNFVGNEARIDVDYVSLDEMHTFAKRYMLAQPRGCFDIQVVAMFCLAMRREVLERVGPLDEAFGIGMFEDDDYSKRVRAEGWRTVCATDGFVHHFGQASFKKLIATGEYQEIWTRNKAYFENKWGKWTPHVARSATNSPL